MLKKIFEHFVDAFVCNVLMDSGNKELFAVFRHKLLAFFIIKTVFCKSVAKRRTNIASELFRVVFFNSNGRKRIFYASGNTLIGVIKGSVKVKKNIFRHNRSSLKFFRGGKGKQKRHICCLLTDGNSVAFKMVFEHGGIIIA